MTPTDSDLQYRECIRYLYDTAPTFHLKGKSAYKANLSNSLALDEYFGHPHLRYPTVHVAGTNGKGSTSHFIAAVLQAAGYRCGLYTSPHLLDFRERIRIDGDKIDRSAVVDFVADNRALIEQLQPSFFEITSTLAFKFFADSAVDFAVIETGLGGRLDSTNIITPAVSVITNIGLEHTDLLGNTIEKIAVEKAGIIKPGVPVVVGEKQAETCEVFKRRAQELQSPLYFAEDLFSLIAVEKQTGGQTFTVADRQRLLTADSDTLSVSIDLEGDCQRKNILSALAALALLRRQYRIDGAALQVGLANAAASTGLMGRWQILQRSPLVICDTGHNAHGLALTMQQLKATPHRRLLMVFGLVSDKDLDSILPLLPRDAYWFITQASIPRAMDAAVLAAKCRRIGLMCEIRRNVSAALKYAISAAEPDDVIYVGGSTFVVAEALGGMS
jgi:dihydrofolate synthase/folylpolyglutamate synthase